MTAGTVKSATGKVYDVIWDEARQQVYVARKGGFLSKAIKKQVGKARSAQDAMRKAADYLSAY
jgi:hypothetical protein